MNIKNSASKFDTFKLLLYFLYILIKEKNSIREKKISDIVIYILFV